MSESSREMAESLLDSTFDLFVDGIAAGRGLDRSAVLEAIDRGPMMPAELEANELVDGTLHLDELLDSLEGEILEPADYAGVSPSDVGFDPIAEVALIYASGNVVSGRDNGRGGPVMAAQTLSEAILDAAEDPAIDALILRIDSPGGSALASEQIWRAIQQARSNGKPIIASFSDLAASGGYYVAVGADTIVSSRGTLTGSIGVFALRPVLGRAFEKLGIGIESMTRGRYADFLLASEPLSDGARRRLQNMVLDTYQLFLERVAAGRELSVEEVDSVAQGRVWTGSQALAAGLVDRIGGLHVAVDEVRAALELDPDADVALVPYPSPRSLSEEIAAALEGRVAALTRVRLPIPDAMRRLESWFVEMPTEGPLLVPPMLVDIH
jgi:protease-4